MISSFKELVVWQKSMALTPLVYAIAAQLPPHERFGLASQIRRAAISIPSNIAEGKKRGTRKDFAQFLRIASGSAAELETQLILIKNLHQLEASDAQALLDEVQRMLGAMVSKLS